MSSSFGTGVAASGASGVGVLSTRDIGGGTLVGDGVSSPHARSKAPTTPAMKYARSILELDLCDGEGQPGCVVGTVTNGRMVNLVS